MKTKIIKDLIKKLLSENSDTNIIGISFGNKIVDGKFTSELGITFYVNEKIKYEDVNPDFLIPEKIEYMGYEFSTDVSTVTTQLLSACPSDFYSWETTPPPNRDLIPILSGGTSIVNGTLGGLVIDDTSYSLAGLTNGHVVGWQLLNSDVNPFFPVQGLYQSTIYQGESEGGQVLGIVKNYYPVEKCPNNTLIDAALVTIPRELVDFESSYRQIGLTGWTQPMDFATTEEIDDLIFTKANLYSSGRTTGAKGEGEMKLVCMATNYFTPFSCTSTQDLIVYVASATTTPTGTVCPFPVVAGDSGSMVSADINGTRKIIGLVAEFVTFNNLEACGVCRIDNIRNLLKISPWTGQTDVGFSNSAITETILTTNNYSDPYVVSDSKTFWQRGILQPTVTPTITPTPTTSQFSTPQPTPTPSFTQTPTRTSDPNCFPQTNATCYTWSLQLIPLNFTYFFLPTIFAWASYTDCYGTPVIKLVEIANNQISYICSKERPVIIQSRNDVDPISRVPLNISQYISITQLSPCGSYCVNVTPTPTSTPVNYLIYGSLIPAPGSTTALAACNALTNESATLYGYITKPLNQLGTGDVIYDINTNLPKETVGNRYRAFSESPLPLIKYVAYWQVSGSLITSVVNCNEL